MTGKHPATFQKYMPENGLGDNVTITEILKDVGYTTAHFGKWHLGPIRSNFYGIDSLEKIRVNSKHENGKDEDIFDTAISFIEKNKTRPFYMNIWSHASHFPLMPSAKMLAPFEDIEIDETIFKDWFQLNKVDKLKEKGRDFDEAMRMYLAEVYSLDFQIGRLMDCVKRLGLEENTILVFTSDQGPAPVVIHTESNKAKAKERLNMVGYAGGLRGGKHSQYEGGIRVPFIVKWPRYIQKNYVDNESVISALDFLPTICSILGIRIDKDYFDGEDKHEVWYGQPENRKEPLFWKVHANKAMISVLDDKWKMHKKGNVKVALFDVEKDPFEQKDVSGQHGAIVQRLTNKIIAWDDALPVKDK